MLDFLPGYPGMRVLPGSTPGNFVLPVPVNPIWHGSCEGFGVKDVWKVTGKKDIVHQL